MHDVVVVGAGVIGLSVATHLSEHLKGRVKITVMADQFSPNTCSDKAGSVMIPIDFSSSRPSMGGNERVKRWTRDTFQHLHDLYQSETNSPLSTTPYSLLHVQAEDNKIVLILVRFDTVGGLAVLQILWAVRDSSQTPDKALTW